VSDVSPARKASSSRSRSRRSSARSLPTRRTASYRRLLTAGDVALGLGIVASRPAVEFTRSVVRQSVDVSTRVGAALFESLPEASQSEIRGQVDTLADTGRQARVDSVDLLVGTVVAEAMSSDLVRTAMISAVEQAMDEVVASAMPSVVEELRSEIGLLRLDEIVRSSVERVLPEVLERDLSAAIVAAAGLPARTARGLVRLPASVLRATSAPYEGSDE
jgi:hypothetical protein